MKINIPKSKKLDLSSIFYDPWQPDTSLQLNNRFWSGQRFENLSILKESESYFENGQYEQSIKLLNFATRKYDFIDSKKF